MCCPKKSVFTSLRRPASARYLASTGNWCDMSTGSPKAEMYMTLTSTSFLYYNRKLKKKTGVDPGPVVKEFVLQTCSLYPVWPLHGYRNTSLWNMSCSTDNYSPAAIPESRHSGCNFSVWSKITNNRCIFQLLHLFVMQREKKCQHVLKIIASQTE